MNQGQTKEQKTGSLHVIVSFWGPFRKFSQEAQKTFAMPEGSTVAQLMEHLYGVYGDEFRQHIIEDATGEFWSLMAIAVNGHIMSKVEALDRALANGDELLLLPPVLGG